MRIAIAGGPRTGKTTLAQKLGQRLGAQPRSTDAVKHLPWGEDSAVVASWFDAQDPIIIIEGVAVARGLRKWLRDRPGKPVDKLIYLGAPHTPWTPAQFKMAKGIHTVMGEIWPELNSRGVALEGQGETHEQD